MIELKEHNIPTYNSLCEEMEKHSKVALVQATGTGKSYIISKYIEEHNLNALILVPANAIGEQWKKLLPNVTVRTYQAMANGIKGEYDLIVADEMHHLGSEVWGKKFVELFMQNQTTKVIGATATEIRYLDNSRDMVEELFKGIAVYGLDLPGAINNGILPTFKYISAYYGTVDDYNKYRDKCTKIKEGKQSKELSRRLELCVQNQISVKDAMYENLDLTKKHRIVVFLNGICEIEQGIKMFSELFPNSECDYVSSEREQKANDKAIEKYQTSKEGISILIAVDMLNEGVHIDGTDCVVMFRNTISPQIYFQQLGRALSARNDYKPIIFDFACNSTNIKAIESTENETRGVIAKMNRNIKQREKKIIIKSYSTEIAKLFIQIDGFLSRKKITGDEAKYIIDHQNEKIEDIATAICRSEQFVKRFLASIGIFENDYADTEETDKKVKELYKKGISIERIAVETCMSRQEVGKALDRCGISDRLRKKVKMIDASTGKTIKIFNSATEAAGYIKDNFNPKACSQNIQRVCAGVMQKSYGYRWEYAD